MKISIPRPVTERINFELKFAVFYTPTYSYHQRSVEEDDFLGAFSTMEAAHNFIEYRSEKLCMDLSNYQIIEIK